MLNLFARVWNEKGLGTKKRTNLYGSPPAKADAPRRILEGNAPANRHEARRHEGLLAVDYVPYQLLRLRRWIRFGIHIFVRRLVNVDFGHRRVKRAKRIPGEAYVDFVYGRGR